MDNPINNQPPAPPGYGAPKAELHPSAIAAIVIGGCWVLTIIIGVIATLALPAFLFTRSAAEDQMARNHLRTLALSLLADGAVLSH